MYDDEAERVYEAACHLVRQGISVIPTGGGVSQGAKEPHKQALIASGHTYINGDGEIRASWKPMQPQLPTAEDLNIWYRQVRARGLGMVTGELSGYVVIDVDLEGLPLMHELGWTPHVTSPSGGAHLYLHHPGWYVQSNASKNKKTLPLASMFAATAATSCFRPAATVRASTAAPISASGSALRRCPRPSWWQGRPTDCVRRWA